MQKKNIIIICLIIVAFFLYLVASQLVSAVFDVMNIPENRDFFLTIPQYAGILVAGLAFLLVVKNERAMNYFNDVAGEMAKVVYPTPKESSQSAVIVIIMVGIATILLAVYDSIWTVITTRILSTGGVS